MIKYKDMIANARKSGLANEQAMWTAIAAVDNLLDEIDDDYTKMHFLREQHEAMNGPHYDDNFAESDIADIMWKDKNGIEHTGAHWTKDQVKSAMADYPLPQGTTACDLWVAANVMYSDLQRSFDDAQILKATHDFFFDDPDGPEGKIWKYMEMR